MTPFTLKKSLFYACFMLMGFFGFIACDNANKPKDTEEIAEDLNEPNKDGTKESDERFLMRAAEMDMEMIQLGQLAQQKGTHADVKAMGKMVADAHQKNLNDLTALAAQKTIAVPVAPTNDVQDALKKFGEKDSGMEFDKEYCQKMVSSHKAAIDWYEDATEGNNDADVKNWAASVLPGLRTHLTNAEACETKLKDMK